MAALRLAAAALSALIAGTAASADPLKPWTPYIREASVRFHLPKAWIAHVILAESGGHETALGLPLTSRAGAMGLMQLMPETWAEMRLAERLGDDPYEPRDNILAGTAYLRAMYNLFGYPGLFAAYNAGPGRYSRYLGGGSALPAETLAYVAKLTGVPRARKPFLTYRASLNAAQTALAPSIFIPLRRPDTGADSQDSPTPTRGGSARKIARATTPGRSGLFFIRDDPQLPSSLGQLIAGSTANDSGPDPNHPDLGRRSSVAQSRQQLRWRRRPDRLQTRQWLSLRKWSRRPRVHQSAVTGLSGSGNHYW